MYSIWLLKFTLRSSDSAEKYRQHQAYPVSHGMLSAPQVCSGVYVNQVHSPVHVKFDSSICGAGQKLDMSAKFLTQLLKKMINPFQN